MATSNTAIANRALRHIGVSKTIASLTEKSESARACLDFYDDVVDEVLRDYDWPFARRHATVAQVATSPTSEWLYSYRVPADCLAVRRILNGSGVRVETEATKIPFLFDADASGGLLYTDLQATTNAPVVVRYTARVTDVTQFPPDFGRSVELLLAAYIAPSLTEGDELKLRERALQTYQWRVRMAWVNAANEERQDIPPDSEFVTVRY
jgi:hypothetical protein